MLVCEACEKENKIVCERDGVSVCVKQRQWVYTLVRDGKVCLCGQGIGATCVSVCECVCVCERKCVRQRERERD